MRTMKWTPKRIVAAVTLVMLTVAALIAATQEWQLYQVVKDEQARTPTPVPGYGNVMQVTPEPGETVQILRSGSQGEAVWALQERLRDLGYLSGQVDGQFGPATKEAVQRFQRQHGLSADGIVGAETRLLLDSEDVQPYITPTPAPTATPVPVAAAPTAAPVAATQAQEFMLDEELPVGFTADGLPLLVNRENPLPDDYATRELVNLREYCDASIVYVKGSEMMGEREAADALMDMFAQAQKEGLSDWQISACYRTVEYQQKLFDDQVYAYRQQGLSGSQARSATSKLVAQPGCSEHHTGLAFDITIPGTSFGSTKQAVWMAENCWAWGFILRYPADKTEITGISNEPWHFRYVGLNAALEMQRTGECLEEYVARKQQEQ